MSDAEPRLAAAREGRSLSTRRGFVAAASFGAVSLYGLWAGYGAAPFRILGRGGHGEEPAAAVGEPGHGGHGEALGPSADEFRRLTDEFVARHREPDGSVRVDPPGLSVAAMSSAAGSDHGAHGTSHAAASTPAPASTASIPAEVYLLAQKWSFEPDVLRLGAGVPYRFRMMAVDVSHGASIQLGRGSRIIRLRQGALFEQELTFTRPGEYLVYCTVYCGIGHDRMSGRIVVT